MEKGYDQYGQLPDLRRFLTRKTHFQPQPCDSEPYNQLAHRNIGPLPPYHEAFTVSNNGIGIGMAPLMPGGLVRNRISHDYDPLAAGVGAGVGVGVNYNSATIDACSASGGPPPPPPPFLRVDQMESRGWGVVVNMDGGNGNSRWPRQETLTLLEIRSRLDFKFKEANQKGPLWDEVSRIMAEEYGYQRSGKKCREKFENLYKYYRKTKEGKAGREDGKNYRFFRQLEALYGEKSNQSPASYANLTQRALLCQTTPEADNTMNQENHQQSLQLQEQKLIITESLSLSNASEFETSSSGNNDHDDLSAIACIMKQSMDKQKRITYETGSSSRVKKGWKTKVKDFVESQMKKLMDSQDVWMERMLKTIEDKEQERMLKDEEWRRQEAARFAKEQKFWAKERAWFEARDAALMEALNKFTGKGLEVSSSEEAAMQNKNHINSNGWSAAMQNKNHINSNGWSGHEISCLIQHRTSFEARFEQESGYPKPKESMWEEIEAKMKSLGYEREVVECEEKWDNMQMYFNMGNMADQCYNKKRKEDCIRNRSKNRSSNYYPLQLDCFDGQQNNYTITNNNSPMKQRVEHHVPVDSNSYDTDSFCIAVNQGDQRFWDRHANVKLSKGKQSTN